MKSCLPPYTLSISHHQYPFKNAHITKIFDVTVHQPFALTRFFHTFLEVYYQVKTPLLLNIHEVKKIDSATVELTYEYVETPLYHYLRRYINDSLQLKMEKLVMDIREIAYKFGTKRVNTLNAIHVHNIGVKMSDVYRESMFVGKMQNSSDKELIMPDFKLYIDPRECSYIDKYEDIARIVIDVEKKLCKSLRQQIDQMIETLQEEKKRQDRDILPKSKPFSQSLTINSFKEASSLQSLDLQARADEVVIKTNDPKCMSIGFSPKRRKMKKKNDFLDKEKIENGFNLKLFESERKQTDTTEESFKLRSSIDGMKKLQQYGNQESKKEENKSFKSQSTMLSPTLCYKATEAIERSKKNLQKFKKQFLPTAK